MLKDGAISRAFIRLSILLLRSVAPLSAAYCITRLTGWRPELLSGFLYAADAYAGTETSFYLLCQIRRLWLNRPAPPHALSFSPQERKDMFSRTWESTPNPRGYLSLWFKGVSIEELCREDVKDWISWRMWNEIERSGIHEAELEEYLAYAEKILNWKFPSGRSTHTSMAVTFEPLRVIHRPLIWYVCFIGGADFEMCAFMRYYGFAFFSCGFTRLLNSLPLRPWSVLTSHRSPSAQIPYWYLPHTSSNHIPILFIHGVGVGLHFYLNFFKDFLTELRPQGIGMIALEILPISSRITGPFMQEGQMTQEIQKILNRHGWTRCIVMSHSYGSVVAAHLLHDPSTSNLIGPMIFVDPVAFSFHPPEVAWNFLRRNPTTASEIQLQYFASTDPDVAYTLTRRFIWSENSLWREDVEKRANAEDGSGKRCTVTLAGKDIIADTNTLGCYLTRSNVEGESWYEQEDALDDDWKRSTWTGKASLEVLWFPELNHAEVFDNAKDRRVLLQVLEVYSSDGAAFPGNGQCCRLN